MAFHPDLVPDSSERQIINIVSHEQLTADGIVVPENVSKRRSPEELQLALRQEYTLTKSWSSSVLKTLKESTILFAFLGAITQYINSPLP